MTTNYATHRMVLAYGESMYLAGRFRERDELSAVLLHSRALAVSSQIYRRILAATSHSFTPPF